MCQIMNKACCHSFAVQSVTANCCGNCGKSLLRCQGFDHCHGLLNEDQFCERCLAPKLTLLDASNEEITRGSTTSFRFELANESPAQVPFAVNSAKIRIGGGQWLDVELAFEEVKAGSARLIQVTTPSFAQAGRHGVEVILILVSTREWRREEMVFTANFEVNVEDVKETIVQQNIHCSGNEQQSGNTIYAPVRIMNEDKPGLRDVPPPRQRVLPLTRSRKYERQFGLLPNDGPFVGPTTEVEFVDFPQQAAPQKQAIGATGSLLKFGRSRTKTQGGTNDVRLIVTDENGQVNEQLSLNISRTHFCVWTERGQLMIKALNQHGILVNGRKLSHLEAIPISHQSRIQVTVGRKVIVEIQVLMESQLDHVRSIKLQRIKVNRG